MINYNMGRLLPTAAVNVIKVKEFAMSEHLF